MQSILCFHLENSFVYCHQKACFGFQDERLRDDQNNKRRQFITFETKKILIQRN